MRRLAMVVAAGVIAFAQLGPQSLSSSGATGEAAARAPAPTTTSLAPTTTAVAETVPHTVMAPIDATRASRGGARSSAPAPSGTPGGSGGDAVWTALARCESGGDPTARSRDGRYSGAFQFSDATWRSLGHGGRAADHPYGAQLAAAKRLQARSGWGQWPRCARRLGLR